MNQSMPKGSLLNKSLSVLALAALMGTAGAFAPALAAGKAAGGGAGGGGSPASGGVKDVGGVLVPLVAQVLSYNGKTPQGSVNLGYAADGTAQSIAFDLTNIKVPDGSVLPVKVIMGRLESIFTYYQITQVVYTEVDGSITVSHGSASLTLSKLNGDVVPDFPAASAAGTTDIQILSPDGTVLLLEGVAGSFHA